MSTTLDLINKIKEERKNVSSSQKDEVSVMRAMLNDKDFKVDVYSKDGVTGQVCPSEAARNIAANVISNTTKMSQNEAKALADNYEYTKADATNMIDISKEFVNTYIQTGRKLPLGGRENSNISLSHKEIKPALKSYPKKVGTNADGSPIRQNVTVQTSGHDSMRVYAPHPTWVK